ncbi:hypothetical protein SKAU_G00286050 [Synaphobranchus kaupii]|uniref:Uncharacterized protein n=1 Tax=Synaphobranchus kaupii TaxID=118154 RepID=A0A9Q1EY90_SYNKA|nr:hypothetical protein SKAU_G00286050 [Synaphobranchus kaupii]
MSENSCAPVNAPQSSSCGIDCWCFGATLDLAITKETWTMSSLFNVSWKACPGTLWWCPCVRLDMSEREKHKHAVC